MANRRDNNVQLGYAQPSAPHNTPSNQRMKPAQSQQAGRISPEMRQTRPHQLAPQYHSNQRGPSPIQQRGPSPHHPYTQLAGNSPSGRISPNSSRAPAPRPLQLPQQQSSRSPVQQLQPAYHPTLRAPQQGPPRGQDPRQQQTYPPTSRPQLQVAVASQPNPFVDPPRAAFAAPPSPSLSSSETLVASPAGLSPLGKPRLPQSPSTSSVSNNAENDRMAPARIVDGGADFWKRFSMVAHEAEEEKRTARNTSGGKDPWLSKEFRGSRKFKIIIWVIAIMVFGGVAGALAWHFTHNDGPKNTQPTKHDFGLNGDAATTRAAVGFSSMADVDNKIAVPQDTTSILATIAPPVVTTSSTRIRATAASLTTTARGRAAATSTTAARMKRMHKQFKRAGHQ